MQLQELAGALLAPGGALLLFAAAVALVAQNRRLKRVAEVHRVAEEQLRALSFRDPLTGLFNRRFMEETLARELQRVARAGAGLAIAVLDVDNLKAVNDTYGHDAGDALLREFAATMDCFRDGIDVACRYGGDEFILVLPGTSLNDALPRLDELRLALGERDLAFSGRVLPRATMSIGVAQFPVHGNNAEALIKAADDALYRAKREGRNRIAVAAAA